MQDIYQTSFERAQDVGTAVVRPEARQTENFERLPRDTRAALAGRRLLYNAGPGPRRSIIGLGLSALYVADKTHPGDESYIPNTVDLRRYLAEHPDEVEHAIYLAITLKAGEMLLLPAANGLHDGSMEGCDLESNVVIFTGHFPRHAFKD